MRLLFKLVYALFPLAFALPVITVMAGPLEGIFSDSYTLLSALSMALGICAYFWFTGQLILSSKPFGLDSWLGVKKLYTFHSLLAACGIVAVAGHLAIKLFVLSYPLGLQTLFGSLALLIIILVSLLTYLFMYQGKQAKVPWIQNIRKAAKDKWDWTYAKLRNFHSLLLLALVLIALHVSFAVSVQYAPLTASAMLLWLVLGVVLHLRYRIRKRKA